MLSDAWARNHLADIQIFRGNSTAAASQFVPWRKRPGATMVQIICIGGGAGGGNGIVGANSTAAGGGSGASGAQTIVTMPTVLLPDDLYVSVGFGGAAATAGIPSRVTFIPDTGAIAVAIANGGGISSASVGGTPGTGGTGGVVASTSALIMGGAFSTRLAGQDGVAGGSTGNGVSPSMPTTGLLCMAGCGGGGLPAAGVAGKNGGTYGGISDFTAPPFGAGGATATTPGADGCTGYAAYTGISFYFGGTGGGSSHGSATTTGLVGGQGGAGGGPGCGGGGGGGALTGSTQGFGGRGGDGIVYIIQW